MQLTMILFRLDKDKDGIISYKEFQDHIFNYQLSSYDYNFDSNSKIKLENQLKATEKRIREKNEIESQRRENEAGFLKQQNESLERFLNFK